MIKLEIQERIKRLERPERIKNFDMEKIISLLPIKPHHLVADIGCGTGLFSIPLARHLTQGKLFALDIEQQMLKWVNQRIRKEGITNIETMLCGKLEFPLKDESLDGVFLANVVHGMTNKIAFLKNVSDLVWLGGWIAVLESKKISPGQLSELLAKAGLSAGQERSIADSYYLIILQK